MRGAKLDENGLRDEIFVVKKHHFIPKLAFLMIDFFIWQYASN